MAVDYKTQYYRYKHYFTKLRGVYQHPAAQVSVALILTLLTISFFGLFAIKPTFVTIAKLIRELKDYESIDKTLGKKIDSLRLAQRAYEEIEPDLIYVDQALPQKPKFNSFASKLNFLAYSNDISLVNAYYNEFTLVPVSSEISFLEFRTLLAGDYANIKTFMAQLENLDRIMKISITHFSIKTEVANAEIQAELRAQILWLKAPSVQ